MVCGHSRGQSHVLCAAPRTAKRWTTAHDHVVDAGGADHHVGDELGGDGCPRLVLLVLARVGEVRPARLAGQPGCSPHWAGAQLGTKSATHTTAVIRLAEAILSVCAMMHSLHDRGG